MSIRVMSQVWSSDLTDIYESSVLLVLADHADDDGRCYPSVARVAKLARCSVRKAQEVIRALTERGYLRVETNKGPRGCNTYFLSLPTAQDAPRQGVHPRTSELTPPHATTPTPAQHAPEPSENLQKPPTRMDAREVVDSEFEKVWYAYPSDRQRAKATCREQFAKAIQKSISPEDMLEAVRAYARETDRFTRSKVCFSDNWFREERWKLWLAARAERAKARPDPAVVDGQLASNIRNCKPWVVTSVSAYRARQLIAAGLVTTDECRAAGVLV